MLYPKNTVLTDQLPLEQEHKKAQTRKAFDLQSTSLVLQKQLFVLKTCRLSAEIKKENETEEFIVTVFPTNYREPSLLIADSLEELNNIKEALEHIINSHKTTHGIPETKES